MIVVDSSALIAILENEPEAQRFLTVLRAAPRCLMSAVTVYETGIVIGSRRGRERIARVTDFIDELSMEIIPFAEPYISRARWTRICATAKESIRHGSISAIARPTRWRKP